MLDRVFNSILGKKDSKSSMPPSDLPWRGGDDQPTGIAESDPALRKAIQKIASEPGVRRLVLLRANGGLFCGKQDGDKESFSRSVQEITVAGKKASRRMGMGAIESVVVEGDEGSIVVATGHSACGIHCDADADPYFVLRNAETLVGLKPGSLK